MIRKIFFASFILLLPLLALSQTPVIFDTDMDSDVDDVQALAMLHAYEKKGTINLLGIIVTSNDSAAVNCTDAINTFYRPTALPLGYLAGQPLRRISKYTKAVADSFPHGLPKGKNRIESTQLYRSLLANSPDYSVVIVTVGHLTSLQRLLESAPDTISPLSGHQLVARKVKKWLCMGGQFPSGKEANFYRPDPGSTRYCIENWSRPAIFCGWEAGNQIKTGGDYLRENLREPNPVSLAFRLYNSFASRPAWDQLAVMLLDGPRANLYLDLVSGGHLSVAKDGSNCWKNEKLAGKDHSYVRIRNTVDPAIIARYMDDLVVGMQPK